MLSSDEDLSDSNEARAMVRRRTTPSDDETETPPCSNRLVATFQDTSSDDDLSDGAEARVMREARARRKRKRAQEVIDVCNNLSDEGGCISSDEAEWLPTPALATATPATPAPAREGEQARAWQNAELLLRTRRLLDCCACILLAVGAL